MVAILANGVRQRAIFLPTKTADPFGNITTFSNDAYALIVESCVDALGNETRARIDYRVLRPDQVTSPNGHVAEVAFDTLARVVATALRSRTGDGDTLDGSACDLTSAQIQAFVADPHSRALNLLKGATTRLVYDLGSAPALHATITRTQHNTVNRSPDVVLAFAYSDGFGREAQMKLQVEPNANGIPRWIGTGWTIYDNKGKPVRQFEPFFSATPAFEFNLRQGVSPCVFYDPLGRVVATLKPDHSWEKIVFDPWRQTTYDAHDTVLIADPRNDADVGHFFKFLPQSEWSPTWYDERIGSFDPAERDAAQKAAAHSDTPCVTCFDVLTRPVLTMDDLGGGKKLKTRSSYDIQGNVLTVTDPRGIVAFTHQFDMARRQLVVQSVDAGHSRLLPDVLHAPVLSWSANGDRVLALFDELHRPTERWLLKPGEGSHRLTQKNIYGESAGSAAAGGSLSGQIWKVFDGAGLMRNEQFDFKNNLERATRILCTDSGSQPEWGTAADPFAYVFDENAAIALLDPTHTYPLSKTYDALNRISSTTTSDGSVQSFSFNETSLLDGLSLRHRSSTASQIVVTNIDYNARGQRTRIECGNGIISAYDYDGRTFQLRRVVTNRALGSLLQDLNYTYDGMGNITSLRDDAHQTVYFAGQTVAPQSLCKYDALYRLIEATGREHVSFGACHYRQSDDQQTEYIPTDAKGQPVSNARALANYTQRYVYDDSGNIKEIRNLRNGTTRWVRTQTYNSASNQIKRSEAGCQGEGADLAHDLSGNLLNLAHLPQLEWNDRNQLIAAQLNSAAANPDRARYQYDGAGRRVRKTITRGNRIEERIYLGDFELFLVRTGSGPVERWEILHLADGKKHIALVETNTGASNPSRVLDKLIRFQFSNHLGSAILETDDSASARIISYEEYTPYGETSYIAGQNLSEVRRKRYRYSGKERDNETGLYYYGARYLAPWIGRWMSCDPERGDGCNLYQLAKNRPINLVDKTGRSAEDVGAEIEQLQKALKGHQARMEELEPVIKQLHGTKAEAELRLERLKEAKKDVASGRGVQAEGLLEQAEQDIEAAEGAIDHINKKIAEAEIDWTLEHAQAEKVKRIIEEHEKTLTELVKAEKAEKNARNTPGPRPPDDPDLPKGGSSSASRERSIPKSIEEKLKDLKESKKLKKVVDQAKRVTDAVLKTKRGRLLADLAEVGVRRGKNFIPIISAVGGGAAAGYALSQGDIATAYLEAAGASQIPIVAQVADAAMLVNDLGGVLKEHLDPDRKMEDWWYEKTGAF